MKNFHKIFVALIFFSSSNAIADEYETINAARCLSGFYISSHVFEKYSLEKSAFKYAYDLSNVVLNIKGKYEFKSEWNDASKEFIIKSQLNLWENNYDGMSKLYLIPCILWFTKLNENISENTPYEQIKKGVINGEKFTEGAQFEVAKTLNETLVNPFLNSDDVIKFSKYGYIEWISLGYPIPSQ